jgi:hypothetical protein
MIHINPTPLYKKQDIEIAGFFAAVFAWGNRTTIIGKSKALMQRMDNSPYAFVKDHSAKDLKRLKGFKHRTFHEDDLYYFIEFLYQHYSKHDSLEFAFFPIPGFDAEHGLTHFKKYLFSLDH